MTDRACKRCVLVVDDDAVARAALAEYLAEEGYEVVTACDGVSALAQLQSCRPDLMITDLSMPRLDGFGLIEALRGRDGYGDLSIIVVSSNDEATDKARALDVGADAFLSKPLDLDLLHAHTSLLV